MNPQEQHERIVLPVNAGLRDAYISILKSMYIEQRRIFWIQELVNIVSFECGVDVSTAEKRCKQLDRLLLISFLRTRVVGHQYTLNVYSKKGEESFEVENWLQFNRLMENQFGDIVESEILRITKKFHKNQNSIHTKSSDFEKWVLNEPSVIDKWNTTNKDKSGNSFKMVDKTMCEEVAERLTSENVHSGEE